MTVTVIMVMVIVMVMVMVAVIVSEASRKLKSLPLNGPAMCFKSRESSTEVGK